jgi:hypothetical protein
MEVFLLVALLLLGIVGILVFIYKIYKSLLTHIVKDYEKEIKKSKAR